MSPFILGNMITSEIFRDSEPHICLPNTPVLVVNPHHGIWLTSDGEINEESLYSTLNRLQTGVSPLVCHRFAIANRIRCGSFSAYDVLELFAFVRPARFCVPTIRGLADSLGLPMPIDSIGEAETLIQITRVLLVELIASTAHESPEQQENTRNLAETMAYAGWLWGETVIQVLRAPKNLSKRGIEALKVWENLSEWVDPSPNDSETPGNIAVNAIDVRSRLAHILGPQAEQRPSQADYASAVSLAFAPYECPGSPVIVLAEAGTGTGKTLGYIAPASLWAEKNKDPVWISTYTRNLQRQLDDELNRLYLDPRIKTDKVVIRKGRENYLCLLNMQEAIQRMVENEKNHTDETVTLGLVARWALVTRDGDMVGGDFPGWLSELMGRSLTQGLTDRRGECVFSACPHFRKCFIERAIRRARHADIVVANHALVMIQAALGNEADLPTRYVFDEGHHVFDAADNAFSTSLSGIETAELRRWLIGGDTQNHSRARGIKRRCEDLLAGRTAASEALDRILWASRILPAPDWQQRLFNEVPVGDCESFLFSVRQQVYARTKNPEGPYNLECDSHPPVADVLLRAEKLKTIFHELIEPLIILSRELTAKLDDEDEDLDDATRQRIDSLLTSIKRRALGPLTTWDDMLKYLSEPCPPKDFLDWFSVSRIEGRDYDVSFQRHWIDPSIPFAKIVAGPAHGLLITSATLRDSSGDIEFDWETAERRTGAIHLPVSPIRAIVPSPFDYSVSTRVLIVNDVAKDDISQVAAAYRELFIAAEGGSLGLFTAVNRLKAVHARILSPLDDAGIKLLAQHVDGMDTSTLIDIFRAEEDACLLGTDAIRDGVDVPGRSLRLIVFDRVPWPRPDLLHKARRAIFGGRLYDDMITRLRLKQAFGRLIRQDGDHGIFVLLDPLMPSRLTGAFPPGVKPCRLGLAEAVKTVRTFFQLA